MTQKDASKGLLIVYTGNGKGKTTAALGMCLRAVGYGWKTCVVQFVKGSWKYGELEGIKRLAPEVELHVVGQGFVGIIDDDKDIEVHREAAREGLAMVREILVSHKFPLVILDELSVALGLDLVDPESVRAVLAERGEQQHIVVTGRGAPDWLIEMADMVTEMKEVKHPFQKGILAQRGIDW